MFCRNCGAELPEGTKFCSKCGAAVQEPTAPPANPAESTPDASPVPSYTPVNKPTPKDTPGRRIPWAYAIGVIVVLGLAVLSITTEIISLQALLILLVFGMLIWIAIKPYILAITLSKKNRAGIPSSLTAAQITSLLTRSPWCEGQKISTDNELIPNTQQHAQIVFEGIRTKAYLYTENGRLYAHSYNLVAVTDFRRSFWAHQEAELLLQYLSALEQGDAASAEKSGAKIRRPLPDGLGSILLH